MGQYTSYYLYEKYEKRGNQGWLPSYPNVYSVDGDGTMPLVKKMDDDPACGYIPCQPRYKWEEIPITEDYICDDCNTPPPEMMTRWFETPWTMCSGTTKYKKEVFQASYDSGNTWNTISPEYSRLGDKIEDNSVDCGYEYPRFEGKYTDGSSYKVKYTCDQSSSSCFLSRREVDGHYAGISNLTDAELWRGSSIGYEAFAMATSLSSVTFNAPESIGEYAFYGCDKIKDISLDVRGLGSFCFANCTGLTSFTATNDENINIPATTGSFFNCVKLKEIDFSKVGFNDGAPAIGIIDACSFMFKNCTSLENVILNLSSYVDYIGYGMFEGCSALTSVTIIKSSEQDLSNVRWHTNFRDRAFFGCSNLSEINYVNQPSNHIIYSIGSYAFYGCTSITGMTFVNRAPESSLDEWVVPELGVGAFDGTTFPIYIPAEAMYDYLMSPNWINYIDRLHPISGEPYKLIAKEHNNYAHYSDKCDGTTVLTSSDVRQTPYSTITGAVISNCITTIGSGAFSDCNKLINIIIPNSVTNIGGRAFQNCSDLKNVHIPNSATSIGSAAFAFCTSLSSITIPNSVTSIGDSAFFGCSGLTSVTVEATTPPAIGSAAFIDTNNCPIYVPYNSLSAYQSAWSSLASRIVAIPSVYRWYPSGTTCYGYNKYINNIRQVSYDKGKTWNNVSPAQYKADMIIEANSYDCGFNPVEPRFYAEYSDETTYSAPYSCGSVTLASADTREHTTSLTAMTSAEVGNGIAEIGLWAFSGCTSLSSVTIGNGVRTIDFEAFYGCRNLTGVTIPDSVTSIGSRAFSGCNRLETVSIGNGVTDIQGEAFRGCGGITSLTLGNSVQTIGRFAFNNCSGITSLTLPASLKKIDYRGLYGCSGLTSINCFAPIPPTLENDALLGTNNCPIYVPTAYLNAYKTAWSQYASRIVGDCPPFTGKWLATYTGGTTSSAECDSTSAITNNEITKSGLTSVEIGDCVTSIDSQAFSNCYSLSSVTIGNNVASIGSWAFQTCTGLTSVVIPDSVTSIGHTSFYQCTSLTSVTIGNSVTTIGYSAFQGCNGLTSVTIPNSVTNIGNSAFESCTGLTSVVIGNGVTSIDSYAFRFCYSLTSVTINAVTPPTLEANIFVSDNNLTAIYVPSQSVSAYRSDSYWGQYSSIIQPIT